MASHRWAFGFPARQSCITVHRVTTTPAGCRRILGLLTAVAIAACGESPPRPEMAHVEAVEVRAVAEAAVPVVDADVDGAGSPGFAAVARHGPPHAPSGPAGSPAPASLVP